MDNLSALHVFVRTAQLRSFTDAGRELGLSSSAIGKSISRLEQRHGVRLLHRSTRSIALTQEGQLFLESCKRIVAEVEKLEEEFAQTRSAPKGRLRVSMPLLGGLATKTLSAFMSQYPEIELDIDFAEGPGDIIDSGYDVVVRADEVDDSRLMTRRIGSYRLVLVCSPGYLEKRGIPSRVEDLVNHACLHLKDAATGKLQPWSFVDVETTELNLPVMAIANATEALISFAELAMGIACVPDFAVRRQLDDGSLCRILDGCLDRQGSLKAIWPSNRYVSPKLRAFIDFFAGHGLGASDRQALAARSCKNGDRLSSPRAQPRSATQANIARASVHDNTLKSNLLRHAEPVSI